MSPAHRAAISKGMRKHKNKRKKHYRKVGLENISRKDRELQVCSQALEILDKIINTAIG